MNADWADCIEKLGAPNRVARVHAAHQLCIFAANEGAMDALIEALRSGCEVTRTTAAFTMGMLTTGSDRAVAALMEALDDPCEPVRRRALISLGEIGIAAGVARSILEARLPTWTRSLQELARDVLLRIEPSSSTNDHAA